MFFCAGCRVRRGRSTVATMPLPTISTIPSHPIGDLIVEQHHAVDGGEHNARVLQITTTSVPRARFWLWVSARHASCPARQNADGSNHRAGQPGQADVPVKTMAAPATAEPTAK